METFREEQRFDQWWLRVLIGGLAIGAWWLFLQQVAAGVEIGGDPAPDWVLVLLWLFVGVAFPAWFFSLRLVTVVDDDGVDVRFKPALGSFTCAFGEIRSYEAVEYHPVREFGGWGVRVGRGGSRALNASGSRGVRIFTTGGEMRLIGSQSPDQLVAAIGFHRSRPPSAS